MIRVSVVNPVLNLNIQEDLLDPAPFIANGIESGSWGSAQTEVQLLEGESEEGYDRVRFESHIIDGQNVQLTFGIMKGYVITQTDVSSEYQDRFSAYYFERNLQASRERDALIGDREITTLLAQYSFYKLISENYSNPNKLTQVLPITPEMMSDAYSKIDSFIEMMIQMSQILSSKDADIEAKRIEYGL